VAALETASATLLTTFRLSFLWSTRKFGDFAFVISLDDLQTSTNIIITHSIIKEGCKKPKRNSK
jgi:hypothetical protein